MASLSYILQGEDWIAIPPQTRHTRPGNPIMKTLFLLALVLCLTIPAAMCQGNAGQGGYDGGSAHVKSQPRPGANFMWQGVFRTHCHVVAVSKQSVTISSSGGLFVAVWENLPQAARQKMQPEYDKIVKDAAAGKK